MKILKTMIRYLIIIEDGACKKHTYIRETIINAGWCWSENKW